MIRIIYHGGTEITEERGRRKDDDRERKRDNALLFGYEGFKIGDLRSMGVGGSGNPHTGEVEGRCWTAGYRPSPV